MVPPEYEENRKRSVVADIVEGSNADQQRKVGAGFGGRGRGAGRGGQHYGEVGAAVLCHPTRACPLEPRRWPGACCTRTLWGAT